MDLDMEIDDSYTEPYDVAANEPRPDSVVYTELFRDLQNSLGKAITLLCKPLEESNFKSYIILGLLNDIKDRAKHVQSDRVIFAVLGDMSVGKSSLINAILSIGTIARKGDDGDSCTWVVQRYMKMFDCQKSPFAAKVFFFDRKETYGRLGPLLVKYYRAANKEDNVEEGEEDGSDARFGEMRDALTVFMALFCDREEFENEDSARQYLQRMKSEDDQTVLEELTDWAVESIQCLLQGNEFFLIQGSTPEQLVGALQPFTHQMGGLDEGCEQSLWPLVTTIDFGLDHPLLNEGIIFVDSPGLSDANAIRSKTAIKYHRECTHRIVVVPIGRAEADTTARRSLQASFRRQNSGSTTILVLTRGDEIDPETQVIGTPSEKKRVAKLGAEISDLRNERKQKEQERRKLRPEDRDELDEEIRSIATDMRRKQAERDGVRVEMRNRKVVTSMQSIYKKLTQDPKPLSALAVGNKVYSTYQAGFSSDEKPYMSVQQTNIPTLRHRLYSMPIEGRYNDVLYFAEVQLPILINSMKLFCTRMHMARKEEIERIILEPKNKLRQLACEALYKQKELALEKILHPMKVEESKFISSARATCAEWKQKHKGKLTLIRNEGHEKGRDASRHVNWNAELSNIAADILDNLFRNYTANSRSLTQMLSSKLEKLCNNTKNELRRDRQFHTMALEPFLKNFKLKGMVFHQELVLAARQLSRTFSSVHERSTTSYDDSFIATAMRPIYADALKLKGRGGPRKRAELIEQRVTKRDDGVWMKVHDSIDASLDMIFKGYEDGITARMEKIFDDLHRDFLRLCDDNEPKEEKDKVQEEITRGELKKNMEEVKAMIEQGGVIPELVAKCKQYSAPSSSGSQLFV